MDIRHHPDDERLLALSAGRLAAGARLLLGSHLELCADCRARLRMFDALGGQLIDAAEQAPLAADALSSTFARIAARHAADDSAAAAAAAEAPVTVSAPPPLPQEARWPRALIHCSATPWRWISPGMRWSRVRVPEAPDANVFLLRIAAGKYLPQHGHQGSELIQVIHGRFHDGRALFGPGDFVAADAQVHHQPVVQEGSECICLASLEGRLRFDSPVARLFGVLAGV